MHLSITTLMSDVHACATQGAGLAYVLVLTPIAAVLLLAAWILKRAAQVDLMGDPRPNDQVAPLLKQHQIGRCFTLDVPTAVSALTMLCTMMLGTVSGLENKCGSHLVWIATIPALMTMLAGRWLLSATVDRKKAQGFRMVAAMEGG